jgi:hypothetical protein
MDGKGEFEYVAEPEAMGPRWTNSNLR